MNTSKANDRTLCRITGLGTAVPGQVVTQHDAFAMSNDIICQDGRQERMMRMMFRKSGVATRRTVIPWKTAYEWDTNGSPSRLGPGTGDRMELYERYAPPLASEACRRALGIAGEPNDPAELSRGCGRFDTHHKEACIESSTASDLGNGYRIGASDVTHLVTVSCTGFAAPGLDIHLMDSLPLSPTVQRVQVGFMGCHGVINGLRTARGLAAADPDAVVLLCAVELCSLHYRMRWEENAMVGNALFADGSAAVVMLGRNRFKNSQHGIPVLDCSSIRLPESRDQMSWRIGNHGFDMTLSGRVPESIRVHVAEWLGGWLAGHGMSLSDVQDWIVHPGGPRVLDATERALGLTNGQLDSSREVLSDLGNMSSPTVLFVLRESLRHRRPGPRVMLAFGPGLVAEAALLG